MSKSIQILNWTHFFLKMSCLVARKSKDSTKIGSVLVRPTIHFGNISTPINAIIATGYNGFPRGVDEKRKMERWERPLKYFYASHSESNVVAQTALLGQSAHGCNLYTIAVPCSNCAKSIIQAGIKQVFYIQKAQDIWVNNLAQNSNNWTKEFNISQEMFSEADVKLIPYNGKLDEKISISGKIYKI